MIFGIFQGSSAHKGLEVGIFLAFKINHEAVCFVGGPEIGLCRLGRKAVSVGREVPKETPGPVFIELVVGQDLRIGKNRIIGTFGGQRIEKVTVRSVARPDQKIKTLTYGFFHVRLHAE